jgi:hypothetical protein
MLHPDSRARGRFAAKLPLLPTSTFRQRFRILTVALAAGICLSVTLEIYAAPRLQSGRFAAKLALLPTILLAVQVHCNFSYPPSLDSGLEVGFQPGLALPSMHSPQTWRST